MKYFITYLLILIVVISIVSGQFGDGMAAKESQRAETEKKRQEYLAKRKASKSSTSTTPEDHTSSTKDQESWKETLYWTKANIFCNKFW